MELAAIFRTLGGLGVVLGLLAAALWVVRRYGLRLPGSFGPAESGRVALVERAGIDGRRSVALVRRDGREHLILLAPEGNMLIETAIVRDEIDAAAAQERADEAEARAAAAEAAAKEAQEKMQQVVLAARRRAEALKDSVGPHVRRAIALVRPQESFAATLSRTVQGTATVAAPAPEPTPKPAPKRTRSTRAAAPAKPRARRSTPARKTAETKVNA